MARNIFDRLESNSEAWRPEQGDLLVGVVVALGSNDGGFGPYTVVTVEIDADGATEGGGNPIPVGDERAWHAFHTVAANELEKLAVRVGDRIGAKYLGVQTAKDGETQFHHWRIVSEPATRPDEPETAVDASPPADPESDEIPF